METTQKVYVKLGALVDSEFTVKKVWGFKWKQWLDGSMKAEDSWFEGGQKKYALETDKGELELSKSQYSQCLEACEEKGKSDLWGKTFQVKSNGKESKEIRYFINHNRKKQADLGDGGKSVEDVPWEDA